MYIFYNIENEAIINAPFIHKRRNAYTSNPCIKEMLCNSQQYIHNLNNA